MRLAWLLVLVPFSSCQVSGDPSPDGDPDGGDGAAGLTSDGGGSTDGGSTLDAGLLADAGMRVDAGTRLDGGGPDDAGRPIERAFAELQPGQLRLISTDTSQFRVSTPSGTFAIIDWTPRMHWDVVTRKIVLIGHRRLHKVSLFDDATGRWRDGPLPMAWQGLDVTGHWYGWSAFDAVGRRIFAKDQVFNVDTETWGSPIAPIPIVTNGANGSMLAWQSNVNRLSRYGGDAQRWMEYDPATNTWPTVVSRVGNGQHALVEFHPMHGKSLIVGGNDSLQVAQLVDPGGVRRRVADFPSRVSMSGGSWLVPHRSGAWLVRDAPDMGTPRLWAYWPTGDQWQDLGVAPDFDLVNSTAAYDAMADAVILAHSRGTSVWKCAAISPP